MKLSLQMRFSLIASAVVLIVLVIFAVYNEVETRSALERSLERQVKNAKTRMINSIPTMLWNYETEQAKKVVESELAAQVIRSVLVFDNEKLVFGLQSDEDSKLKEIDETVLMRGEIVEIKLEYDDNGTAEKVGRLLIEIDESSVENLLSEAHVRVVVQTIILLTILISTIILLMKHIVIKRLDEMTEALKNIAQGEGDLTQRLKVGEDEVGQLSAHFNRFVGKIQGILKEVIESVQSMDTLTTELLSVSKNTSKGVNQLNLDRSSGHCHN